MSTTNDLYRRIPSVDGLLREVAGGAWATGVARPILVRAVREAIRELRAEVRGGALGPEPSLDERLAALPAAVRCRLRAGEAAGFRPVVNATGVVIHTNLGRSVLADAAIEAVQRVAGAYGNLEFDLEHGVRGSRRGTVEALLREATGAEAALAVNNNAAAILLALSTLARGREVIVSRGELVEIGGGFRMPDVMEESGAILREVGTTNRTRPDDYRRAVTERTALVLKVHTSNYRVVGFTESVSTSDLAALAHSAGLPLVEDLGSGMLVDLKGRGIGDEPSVGEVVRAGADLVCFSGDKLLGGPQAGILIGRRDLVDRLARAPLARSVRIDKLSLAALEATVRLALDPDRSFRENPTLRMAIAPEATMKRRALALARAIRARAPGARVDVARGESAIGGGSLPGLALPTWLVRLDPGGGRRAEDLMASLRRHDPPVIARIIEDHVALDPRTLLPGDEKTVAEAAAIALGAGDPSSAARGREP